MLPVRNFEGDGAKIVEEAGLLTLRHGSLENENSDVDDDEAITEYRPVATFNLIIANRKNHTSDSGFFGKKSWFINPKTNGDACTP